MSQITFADKVALNPQPDVADINKVTDNDMNMIKDAHNDTDNKVTEILDLQYCIATISSSQTISSNYTISLNSIDRSNGNFSLSNGGIRIGAGINSIRVSGSVFVDGWPGSSNYLWGQIKKNSTIISGSIVGSTASYLSAPISSTIISVEEGDIIYLIADSGAGGNLRIGADNTFLCIEKIN